MSEHKFINTIAIGDSFSSIYYLENAYEKLARNGNKYTDLSIRDKSGNFLARFWGTLKEIKSGDFIKINANGESYLDKLQIIIQKIEKVTEVDNLEDYVMIAENREENKTFFMEKLEQAKVFCPNLNEIFDEKTLNDFIISPASVSTYYGKVGSLLEYTVNIIKLSENIANNYGLSEIEKSILLTSVILHRVGSIETYANKCVSVEETTTGILIGEVGLSISKISEKLKQFEHYERIMHCISSYKSQEVKPATKEAIILSESYFADLRMVTAFDMILSDEGDDDFTAPDSVFKRRYFKKGIASSEQSGENTKK